MEFKEYALIDCLSELIDYRGKTPKKLGGDWSKDGKYRAISAKNIKNNELVNEQSIKKVDDEIYKKWMKKEINKGDILLTSEAPLGETYYWDSEEKIVLSQRVYGLRANTEILTSKYLYAYMQSKEFLHELTSRESGTTVTGIRQSELGKVKIKVPVPSIQSYIGRIIYDLNKKIQLNKDIIRNLELISQVFFKQWFIDFEFPNEDGKPYKSSGGEMLESEVGAIPNGWQVKSLDDVAKFQNGLAMQKFRPSENNMSLPVLKIKELNQGNTTLNSERCSLDIKEEVKVFDGDVIFSWSGTLLVKIWTGGNAGLNQHLFKVTSEKYDKWFYYLWTKYYLRVFQARAAEKATTMGHIKRSHLKEAKVFLPSQETLTQASELLQPLIEKRIALGIETKKLADLRDTLLPKLLAGEVDILDALEV